MVIVVRLESRLYDGTFIVLFVFLRTDCALFLQPSNLIYVDADDLKFFAVIFLLPQMGKLKLL